jgi:glycosyltransferase involved in cell wall biosynthesis
VTTEPANQVPGLLLIGPADRGGRFLGGATASFREFTTSLDREGIAGRIIDTRHFAGRFHAVPNLLRVLALSLARVPAARVVLLFASRRGILYLGPAVCLLARLARTRFCLRPFGGEFVSLYHRLPAWHRFILRRTIFQADALLVETRSLLQQCEGLARNAVWFPNSRPGPSRAPAPGPYRRRFVFLSQVTEEKGVGVLLAAMAQLDASFTVHVYGPVRDEALGRRLEASGCYRGVVSYDAAVEVLRDYDVLVLPTFTPNEGYPGAIVEAFSVGMPVIATDWLSIGEIVRPGESGLLIPPRSGEALAAAMRSIDDASLARMRDGAARAFEAFESGRVHRAALRAIAGVAP